MWRRLQFAKEIVPHDRRDAGRDDGGARAFAGANDRGDLRFGLEQADPRLGQQVNIPAVSRAKDGMARHNLHAFGNILGLHGAVSEDHSGSETLATRLFMVLLRTVAFSRPSWQSELSLRGRSALRIRRRTDRCNKSHTADLRCPINGASSSLIPGTKLHATLHSTPSLTSLRHRPR